MYSRRSTTARASARPACSAAPTRGGRPATSDPPERRQGGARRTRSCSSSRRARRLRALPHPCTSSSRRGGRPRRRDRGDRGRAWPCASSGGARHGLEGDAEGVPAPDRPPAGAPARLPAADATARRRRALGPPRRRGPALSARAYTGDGAVVLELEDAFLPENRAAGESRTARGADADADLALGVGELGAVYLGGFGFGELVRAGVVSELKEEERRADALFRTDAAVVPEIFYEWASRPRRQPVRGVRALRRRRLNPWLPLFASALSPGSTSSSSPRPSTPSSTLGLVLLGALTAADFVGDKIRSSTTSCTWPGPLSRRCRARSSSPARRGSRPTCRPSSRASRRGDGRLDPRRRVPSGPSRRRPRAASPTSSRSARISPRSARRRRVRPALVASCSCSRSRSRSCASAGGLGGGRAALLPSCACSCGPSLGALAALLVLLVPLRLTPCRTARSTSTSSTSNRSRSTGPRTGR